MGFMMAILKNQVSCELNSINVREAWLLKKREYEINVSRSELPVQNIALVISSYFMDSSIDKRVEVKEPLANVLPRNGKQSGIKVGAESPLDHICRRKKLFSSREVVVEQSKCPSALIKYKSLLKDRNCLFPE